jgi:ribosome-associated protein
MIQVTPDISIREAELDFRFIRAAGPGGQNVNKVSTAVQLRYDAGRSPGLPEEVRRRLARLAGRRMTGEGVLVIEARRFRSQDQNRRDALLRLIGLIREAAATRKPRRPTGPSRSARERRLREKRARGQIKRERRAGGPAGE